MYSDNTVRSEWEEDTCVCHDNTSQTIFTYCHCISSYLIICEQKSLSGCGEHVSPYRLEQIDNWKNIS